MIGHWPPDDEGPLKEEVVMRAYVMRAQETTAAAIVVAALLGCSGPDRAETAARQTIAEDSGTEVSQPMVPSASDSLAFPFSLPYEVEAPCEYCLDPVVVCAGIEVRAEGNPDAPVVAVAQAGDTLILIDGRTLVVRPDIVVFSDTLRVAGAVDPRTSSPEVKSIVFQPGDTVFVLTYGGEGSDGEWWYRGRVIRSDNAWMLGDNLERVSRDRRGVATSLGTRVSQWWMKVRDADGVEGWVQDDGRSVRYGNHFDPEIRPCPGGVE